MQKSLEIATLRGSSNELEILEKIKTPWFVRDRDTRGVTIINIENFSPKVKGKSYEI